MIGLIIFGLLFFIIMCSLLPKKDKKRGEKEKGTFGTEGTEKTEHTEKTNSYQGPTASHYNNDDLDYERYRAQAEEQAAYDDFIASLDMDD